MPDPNPISGLYPQPVNPASAMPSILSNPIGAASGILGIQQQQSARAVGQAYQNALNPDGTIDQFKLAEGLKNPAAAWGAPDAITRNIAQQGGVLSNQGQALSNYGQTITQGQSQETAMNNWLAGLSAKPGVSSDDILQSVPTIARQTNLPADYIMARVRPLLGLKGQALANALRTVGAGASGQGGAGFTGARVGSVTGTGANVTTPPTTAVFSGAPANPAPGADTAPANSIPTSLSPQDTGDISEYQKDQGAAAKTLANVRPLQQALPLAARLADTEFGPTSSDFTKVKATLASLGVIDPNTSDGAVRQEVGKYLLRYASGAQAAGRSDQALSAAMGSNPNPDTMMKPATLALIKNQIGMDRMDAALPKAAPLVDGTPKGYQTFRSSYYQDNDPRAFSFDLMSQPERQDLLKSLGPKTSPAYQKFMQSYNLARRAGVIPAPPAQSGQ